MALVKCRECGNEISSNAKACPHCGARQINKIAAGCGGLVGVTILAIVIGPMIIGNSPHNSAPERKWESVSGVQQGVTLVMDIDDNSIQRTSDGASATVDVKLNDNDIENITYLCRTPDPATGMHGGVIWKNDVSDLPYGSTSEAIMKRVCYGPLP